MYMQNQLLQDQDTAQQSQIYDNLSLFLKLFRRSVALAQIIALLAEKEKQYAHLVQKLKAVFEEWQPLRQRYDAISGPILIKQPTFSRFACRLLQIIYLYNSKYKQMPVGNPLSLFLQSLKQIQSTIRQCQQSRMFLDIIRVTQLSFVKFCIHCNKTNRNSDYQSQQKRQLAFRQLKQTLPHRFHTQKTNVQEQNQTVAQFQSVSSNEESDHCSNQKINSLVKINAITVYNRQLYDVQKRFDTLRGLDLDFSDFRAQYFLAKNNRDQLFKDFLKRNEPNRRIITQYQDDFYLFQKKKTNKELKKKKLNSLYNRTMGHTSIGNLRTISQLNREDIQKIEEQISERIQTQHTFNYTGPQRNNLLETVQTEDGGQSVAEPVRKQLKMNNVQFFLRGRPNIKKTHNNYRNLTRIQPTCLNSYNSLQSNSKECLSIYGRLKIEAAARNPMKTQPPSTVYSTYNNSIVSQKQSYKLLGQVDMAIRSKSTFKGKYLEVNCVRKREEGEGRRRVQQNGPITRININNTRKGDQKRKQVFNLV